MKRSILIATSAAVVLWFTSTAAFAQGHPGGGHPGGPPSMAGGSAGSHGESGMHDTMGANKSESVSTVEGNKAPGTLLTQNTKLASKLSALLAKQNPPITDLQAASSGFKNLGQFVSAVHVSNNLNIPFTRLKTAIMNDGSLGKAIKALRPDADSKAETKTAQKQTDEDVRASQTDADTKPGS
jgi:hypothetical protein